MKVHTVSDKLRKLRRGVMELYISDHPLDCLTCSANGNCELQTAAGEVGLRDVRYGYEGENHLSAPVDGSNPYFNFDPSKCIVCSRCVRACEEVQGTFALTIQGRGFASKVAAGMDEPFLTSECVSCGACVQACPTATLMEKSVVEMGQPEHSVVTTCAYCGVGLQLQGGDARRSGGAHGAVEGRQGQSRALVRQGPVRLGLRAAPRPHPEADDPREDHRSMARSKLGRGDRAGRLGVQAYPGEGRQGRGRGDHLVALHRRGSLSGAKAHPHSLRQ